MNNIIVSELKYEVPDFVASTNVNEVKSSTTKKPKKSLSNVKKMKQKKSSKVVLNHCIKKTSTDKQNLILQKKSIVFNVYSFFKKLAVNPRRLNFNQAQLLTAEACGISLATVKRVTRSYCVVDKLEDSGSEQNAFDNAALEDVAQMLEVEIDDNDLQDDDNIDGENIIVIENNDSIEDIPCLN